MISKCHAKFNGKCQTYSVANKDKCNYHLKITMKSTILPSFKKRQNQMANKILITI